MFDPNQGRWDRVGRLALGVLLGTIAVSGAAGVAMTAVATVLTVVLFATAAAGFCPLYGLFDIDTSDARRRAGAEG